MSGQVPTVDQIEKDTITKISYKYWSQQDENVPLEAYDPNLIEDIYKNELAGSKFALSRIMLLEFSQYLENYLWKYYQIGQATKAHVVSIATMVNEKFRERVYAWACFSLEEKTKFSDLFTNVLNLCLSKFKSNKTNQYEYATYQEHSILIKFLDNCVNSLEVDLIRVHVQKICNLGMCSSLSCNRREYEFKKFPKLKKFWKALEKKEQKWSEEERTQAHLERFFLKNLIKRFIKVVHSLNSKEENDNNNEMDIGMSEREEDVEMGEVDDDAEKNMSRDVQKFKLNFLNRCLELIIDLEALLPTRRFFNTLLDDTNLLIQCYLSDLIRKTDDFDVRQNQKSLNFNNDRNLFKQLYEMLKFYTTFEIDDQSGEAKTSAEIEELHYDKLKSLQKGVFKYFRDDLMTFALTNISTIDKRETLIKQLNGLTEVRLYSLAEYLHLVPHSESNPELVSSYTKDLLLEIIIWHMEKRRSQIKEINSMPLYPNESIIWDENIVPSEFRQTAFHDTSLALPKLNLQFLTLHDYLWRNFNLFRLESAYELRQDLEDACIRSRPYYSYEDQQVCFANAYRMAQSILNFGIVEVAKPNVGETAPSKVRAEITIDVEMCRDDVRQEWDSMRKYDTGFLVTLRPKNTVEQKYDPKLGFLLQSGLLYVRGCEIEGILNDEGKLIGPEDQNNKKFKSTQRVYRVFLDANQYKMDNDRVAKGELKEDIYTTFNLFCRRRPKESNFKAILESIRDLMNTKFVVPEWLRDLILGYGDPASAHYKNMIKPEPIVTLDFNDTFLSYDHLKESFPNYEIELKKSNNQEEEVRPPFRITFTDLLKDENKKENKVIVEPYRALNRGPYPQNEPKRNQVKFTPTQIEAIKSGMQPGLTICIGPPGTGKTDVAVQIISNIYHNFPDQKTLIVTHSNQALNQLFEKIMHLDIDERHLLRLGHGEEELETEKDFSRYGRVNYALAKRLELLDEVDRLQKSFYNDGIFCESAAYSCETAVHFYLNYVVSKWEVYTNKIKSLLNENKHNKDAVLNSIEEHFPYKSFFSNAPQPLFKKNSFNDDYEIAKGCYRYIKKTFKQLEEFRAFELIRNGADRAEYLLVKEAKIVAMTCTHAALKRADLVKLNFRYDNIIMEEAAQILEIETFLPLLLQNPDHFGNNRLKRWIMIGDHNQLPPVIKNVTFQKYSNMEQSLFTRFVKLGIPTVDLDAQGRARSSLCDLFRWRYKNLGDLVHVNARDEFQRANTGFVYDYQLINVEDFNGQGESEPQPYFYQNVAEAEYVVAVYMYMRMLGYAAESITILSTYNGQKHLIRDVLRKRCGKNQVFGFPKTVTTVDKYQGSQNDIILLSLVRTKSIGHLRDVRRLIVAMSRARLGLYVFARQKLFKSCFELTPVFNLLQKRSTKLELVIDETFPTRRGSDEQIPKEKVKIMQDMPEMTQFVFGFYQQKLNQWQKTSKNQQQSNQNDFNRQVSREERRRQLDEEEKVLRARLESTIEKVQQTTQQKRLNINFDDDSSSSEEEESFEENNDQQQVEESENTAGEEKQKVDALAESSNDSQNQESD